MITRGYSDGRNFILYPKGNGEPQEGLKQPDLWRIEWKQGEGLVVQVTSREVTKNKCLVCLANWK